MFRTVGQLSARYRRWVIGAWLALAMAASSVTVVSNSLRLRGFRASKLARA